MKNSLSVGGVFGVECIDKNGNQKWADEFHNLVTNAGLDYIVDVALSGGTQISTWYIGLKDTGTIAAGDTMSSHAGWSELTNYSNSTRVTWTDAGVSSQSATNSASTADFTINGTDDVYGVFFTSNNTKSGTTGTLFSAGDFSSARSVESGDTLKITYTFTAADDGA